MVRDAPDVPPAFDIRSIANRGEDAPKHPNGPGSVVIDATGAWALTRDIRDGVDRPPLAWNLATGRAVDGTWLRLVDDGVRGLRKEADGAIAVAELASGEVVCAVEGLRWPAAAPVPSPDGGFAVSAICLDRAKEHGPSPSVTIWDLSSGRRLREIIAPMRVSTVLAGERLVAADDQNRLEIRDLGSGEQRVVVRGPREKPALLRVDLDGRRAVTIGVKGLVTVWDLATGAVAATHDAMAKLRGGPPKHAHLLADGRLVAEGIFLDVLDLATGELDRSWQARNPNRDRIRALAPLADHPAVVVLLMSRGLFGPNTLEVWDVDQQSLLGQADVSVAQVLAVARSGRAVVAGDDLLASFQLGTGASPSRPAAPAAKKAASAAKKAEPAAKRKAAPAAKRKAAPAAKKQAALPRKKATTRSRSS